MQEGLSGYNPIIFEGVTLKRISSLVMPVILALAMTFLFLQVSAQADSDLLPPNLVGLRFAPATVDVSAQDQTITFTAQVTDDLSGIAWVQISFASPSGQYSAKATSSQPFSGDALSGTLQSTVFLPQYAEAGEWPVSHFSASDLAGNIKYWYRDDLMALGMPITLTVLSTHSDLRPPSLVGYTFTPAVVDVSAQGQPVTFTVQLSDDLSGIGWAHISLVSPSGQYNAKATSSQPFSGDALSGTFQCIAWLPQYAEAGEWSVNTFSANDRIGNSQTWYRDELAALGMPLTLTVVGSSDSLAPVLLDLATYPAMVDANRGERAITTTMALSDDLSGIGWVHILWDSPVVTYDGLDVQHKAHIMLDQLLSGDALSGTYQGTTWLPQYAVQGVWRANYVNFTDLAGNVQYYYETDLADMGLPTTFMNGSLVPSDTQTTLSYDTGSGLETVVDVPAGALTETVLLGLNDLSTINTAPQGYAFAGRVLSLGAYLPGGTPLADLHFNQPLTLTLEYTAGLGLRDETFILAYWDGTAWEEISQSCPGEGYAHDPAARQVRLPLCHPGVFALFSQPGYRFFLPVAQR